MNTNKYSKNFAIYETDKLRHAYHVPYDLMIGDAEIKSALEIGVKDGKSLRAWSAIWPDAEIEGMDVNEPSSTVLENFKIHIGSSTNYELEKNYDIIIDDGSHHWKDQVSTLLRLYDKANRFYVIEDIRAGYSLGHVVRNLPPVILSKASFFRSELDYGKINFEFSGNLEMKSCHFIMIIDKTR